MKDSQRDSLVFYRSFYEALKEVDNDTKAKVYDAIFEYSLNFNEVELSGLSKALFTLIRPQLDANNQRYRNGNKGGRPKKEEQRTNQTITKSKPNNNLNETKEKANDNDNVNANVNEKENKEIMSEHSSDDTPLLNLDTTNQTLEVKITKSFFDLFRNNQQENGVTIFTKYDKTKLRTWLVHVKRMIEIDKISIEDLREVHVWLSDPKYRNSEFWRKNIISTQKLREQFPKLQSAMKDDLKTISNNKPQRSKSRLGL